jgi:hypothetical protein
MFGSQFRPGPSTRPGMGSCCGLLTHDNGAQQRGCAFQTVNWSIITLLQCYVSLQSLYASSSDRPQAVPESCNDSISVITFVSAAIQPFKYYKVFAELQ